MIEALRDAISGAQAGDDTALRAIVAAARAPSSAVAIVMARAAVVLREYDRALALLEAPPPDRDHGAAVEWRVGLCARLGRYHEAVELAERSVAERPSARRHESAARLLRSRYDREGALRHLHAAGTPWALREIERVTQGDAPGDEEAHVVRAEALASLGRTEEAEAELARAGRELDGFSEYLAANAVRALIRGTPLVHIMGEEGTLDAARALLAASGHEGDATDPATVLALLRGNRSTKATIVRPDGSLFTVPVAPSSRTLSRWAQRRLEHAPASEVLAGFADAMERYPESSLPYCYRGEVHLWLGDLERADADFTRALDIYRLTFWAWVGRGAVQLLRGEPHRALATFDELVRQTKRVGPTLFVYRGEARRLVGDHAGAIEDLERSRADRENRVGAWVNLGLARAARGEHEELRSVVRHLRSAAHAFFADAAREVGLAPAMGHDAPIEDLVAVLSRMLVMARGNRSSSCLTYFSGGDELRFVAREWLDDREELAALALVLDRMLGRVPPLASR